MKIEKKICFCHCLRYMHFRKVIGKYQPKNLLGHDKRLVLLNIASGVAFPDKINET